MSWKHSATPRRMTLKAMANPPKWTSKFGRLFPKLPAAKYGGTHEEEVKKLGLLAEKMIADFDEPKDGPDDEESGIPALYTYFGQFIDHDLTFDPESSFRKKKDADAVIDFRTPAFDLENLYGRGPDDQPYLYDEDGKSFLLGDLLTLGASGAKDLQRNSQGRALIGDPGNDENAIVSQFQGLFLAFHNRVIRDNKNFSFDEAQDLVRWHYQFIVVNDFLPRIVSASVLDDLKTDGAYDRRKLRFAPRRFPFLPIEFSVAAYRLGHSMVRPGYRLNDATLVPIFPNPPAATSFFPEGLTGFRRMISDWGIDWGRFIDIDIRNYDGVAGEKGAKDRQRRLQFAYRIDTSLVDPLSNLPLTVTGDKPFSLALRNLLGGVQFGLPNGQAVAQALGVAPLEDKDILIGKGTTAPDTEAVPITAIDEVFAKNCQLWTHVLAEAMHNKSEHVIPVTVPDGVNTGLPEIDGKPANTTPQLGPVGGRIVAEVFLCLLFSDSSSILNQKPAWHPPHNPSYNLKDFIEYALG